MAENGANGGGASWGFERGLGIGKVKRKPQ